MAEVSGCHRGCVPTEPKAWTSGPAQPSLTQVVGRADVRVSPRRLKSRTAAHLPFGVAEDDGLRDGQCVVEIAQRVKLPLFSFHRHKELLDAFQSQLITRGQTQIPLPFVQPRLEDVRRPGSPTRLASEPVCPSCRAMSSRKSLLPQRPRFGSVCTFHGRRHVCGSKYDSLLSSSTFT